MKGGMGWNLRISGVVDDMWLIFGWYVGDIWMICVMYEWYLDDMRVISGWYVGDI